MSNAFDFELPDGIFHSTETMEKPLLLALWVEGALMNHDTQRHNVSYRLTVADPAFSAESSSSAHLAVVIEAVAERDIDVGEELLDQYIVEGNESSGAGLAHTRWC